MTKGAGEIVGNVPAVVIFIGVPVLIPCAGRLIVSVPVVIAAALVYILPYYSFSTDISSIPAFQLKKNVVPSYFKSL